MSDFRVPLETLFEAFSVPAVVTRPAPDNTPISTDAIWLQPEGDTSPFGRDLARSDARPILVLKKSAVPSCDRGTTISAPPADGDAAVNWRVDGYEDADSELIRVFVKRVA